jgi:hypothetical protein
MNAESISFAIEILEGQVKRLVEDVRELRERIMRLESHIMSTSHVHLLDIAISAPMPSVSVATPTVRPAPEPSPGSSARPLPPGTEITC